VADEWDCLEEGEIYATVHDERTGKTEAIIGRVLVTRSPQVHPGDVQFVTAVRRPQLSETLTFYNPGESEAYPLAWEVVTLMATIKSHS
jgi:hypothetical protein